MEDAVRADAVTPRTDRIVFAREAHMLAPLAEAAHRLCAGLPGEPEVFFEVPLAAGVPDLVIVAFEKEEAKARAAAMITPLVDVRAVRTLVALSSGIQSLTGLAAAAGVGVAHLRRYVVPDLIQYGWATDSPNGSLQLVRDYRPVVSWVVAVEAKRAAWAQAHSQAQRMLPAADRVYIALDAVRAARAIDAAEHMASLGIGLVTVQAGPAGGSSVPSAPGSPQASTGARVSIVQNPQPRRPGLPPGHRRTSPAAKAVLGERVWALHREGRRHGPTHPVFGLDLSR